MFIKFIYYHLEHLRFPEIKDMLADRRAGWVVIFRKWDVGVWIGSSWLRIGTSGGHL